ncbi:DUF6121 family protein [Frigoribacterium sp. CG_9.8]|uniref:DUF6121 family protein n=1 Tax=Frigoribacterium sp. CG_9.8 TaxID=2787733 RepID=UPI0018CA23D5|nr:di/tricarboxylate transporter [Frigoribacterium sp. CG_9.8]
MDARSRFARTIAVFAAVLFLALAIAASGIISLFADREVLTERDAGPLIAPIMFAVATAALYAILVAFGRRRGFLFTDAIITAVVTYFSFLIIGSALYSLGKGQLLVSLLFFGSNAIGPFAIAVAVIAFVVALAFLVLLSYRDGGGAARTPRWWWENRDDHDRRE